MKLDSESVKTISPLGALSVLPREIRDKIYSNLFGKQCEVDLAAAIRPLQSSQKPWTGSQLGIIFSSKSIREETLPLLSSTTFVVYHNLGRNEIISSKAPNVGFVDRIMNVRIHYEIPWSQMYTHDSSSSGPAFRAINLFKGPNIKRDLIIVDLIVVQWLRNSPNIMDSPLFEALKNLTGFESVVLRLSARANAYFPLLKDTPEDMIIAWVATEQWEELYGGFLFLLPAMGQKLEPTLGPSSDLSELKPSPGLDDLRLRGYRQLEFHPREYLAGKHEKDEADVE